MEQERSGTREQGEALPGSRTARPGVASPPPTGGLQRCRKCNEAAERNKAYCRKCADELIMKGMNPKARGRGPWKGNGRKRR